MRLSKTQIIGFQRKILTWWQKNKRDLPWRHTYDPYKILVSEIMLQQTQVSRVLPVYTAFLAKFPSVVHLSHASPAVILRAWKGMGYNRRALYLKKTAEVVVRSFGGIFPSDETSLRTLSGVGLYTARAIQVFAFQKDVAMVDTNIRKIITHFFFRDTPQKEVIILDTARQLVPKGRSWQWHQALMDYGALGMTKVASSAIRHRGENKSTIPFKVSDRYFRGKIIDDLRTEPIRISTLRKKYIHMFSLTDERMSVLFDRLTKDGLIAVTRGMAHLPK